MIKKNINNATRLLICWVALSCSLTDGKFVDTKLGTPQFYMPDKWMIVKKYCSDTTFVMKYNGPDNIHGKFDDDIVINKLTSDQSAEQVSQLYLVDIKRKYEVYKIVAVGTLQSAKTSGILIDYAFQARGMTLASTVYTGKFAGVKSTFLF